MKMKSPLAVSLFFLLPGMAFAAAYPGCIQGRQLGAGTRFELQAELKKGADDAMAKILYKMGTNSGLIPSFPRMNVGQTAIAFVVKPNPNAPKEARNPAELDRMARLELEEVAKLKSVALYCD
jgi:hypothetical protein